MFLVLIGDLITPRLTFSVSDETVVAQAKALSSHHEHPSSTAPDHSHSFFMPHTSGAALLIVGMLVFADRLTRQRYRGIAVGIGITWVVFGVFLFIKADPEGWPVGPAGFLGSLYMPTAGEWLQHKILSFVPILMGIYNLAAGSISGKRKLSLHWKSSLAVFTALGAAGLLIHQHANHPGMDVVNIQHRLFALTGFIISAGLFAEARGSHRSQLKSFLFPSGLLLFGLQLIVFTATRRQATMPMWRDVAIVLT